MRSCTNSPRLRCVPPEIRDSVTRVPVTASSASSSLSPSTRRQSSPAVKNCRPPIGRDHCAMPPTPVVGTSWFSVMRPMLRGGVAAGTARKLLRNRAKSVNTLACRSLSSGNRTRMPPLAVVHLVSFASSVPSIVLALPLSRSSRKCPPRTNACTRSDSSNWSRRATLRKLTAALLSTRPRSASATIGYPSVSKTLASSEARTRPHTSLPETSSLGVLRVPYCERSSSVRRVAGPVTTLITPPIA
jgi:hypothetical protein